MPVIPVSNLLTLKTTSVTFAVEGEEVADFSSHVTGVELVPTASSSSQVAVNGQVVSDTSATEWSLKLNLFQDVAPTGLMHYLYTNEGKKCAIVATLQGDQGKIAADVTLMAAPIGGVVDGKGKTSAVTLPCDGRPDWK